MSQGRKLTAELVPQTSWYSNLRNAVSRPDWDALRRRVYTESGHRCGICRGQGRLNCHEVWEYDDAEHVQALRGFIALCDWCHHLKHIGLAGVLAGRGKLDYDKVVEHFLRVNGCDRAAFEEHIRQAMSQWCERSEHPWRVDLGAYEGLVARPDRRSDSSSSAPPASAHEPNPAPLRTPPAATVGGQTKGRRGGPVR